MFKQLDFYSKHVDDDSQRVRTSTGALISVISIITCLTLVIVEFTNWVKGEVRNELTVDTSTETEMTVFFDIVFPRLECRFLAVDLTDQGGKHLHNIWQNIEKTDLELDGSVMQSGALKEKYSLNDIIKNEKDLSSEQQKALKKLEKCLPCFEATSEQDVCCNTCGDLIAAFQKTKMDFIRVLRYPQCKNLDWSNLFVHKDRGGCRVKGSINAGRVEGRLSLSLIRPFRVNATGPSGLIDFLSENLNMTHTINHFSFGKDHPALKHPLKGHTTYQPYPGFFNYIVKIVPTTYISSLSNVDTYQYSVTRYSRRFSNDETHSPGVYIYYEFTPQRIILRQSRASFLHFLVRLCAVVGGVFSVAAALDNILYTIHLTTLSKTDPLHI